MLAQFHQSHAFAQTHGTQFFADRILPQAFGNRVGHASCHFSKIKQLFPAVNLARTQKSHASEDVAHRTRVLVR
jgi:hypothetical protein